VIDTHCHLTFEGLHDQAEAVIDRAIAAGVGRMISVGTTPDDALRAIALAERHAGVFAAVGLHPGYVRDCPDLDAVRNHLLAMAAHPRVVALGEMGLDRHWPEPTIDVQRPAFALQLSLLHACPQLPAVIHNREATSDTLAMIRDSGVPGERFVFHCFTGSRGELEAILAAGAMVSFTGAVTFKNNRALAEASDLVPLNRLMVETDAPFLTPEPHRKVRPNEPRFVTAVARFIAERRGMRYEDFDAAMDANAARFFRLPT
jgi:TatD DNase family protein